MMCMTVLLAGCNAADMEQQIDELYAKMSQEERIAQLRSTYMDDFFDEKGVLDTAKCHKVIPFGIGHFSQYASQKPIDPNVLRDRVAAMQDWLMHHTPNGIPALFHEEVLSGVNTQGATIYPQQIGQACSFNTELAEQKTLQTGTAMRKMGGVLSLSPMVDVCRTPVSTVWRSRMARTATCRQPWEQPSSAACSKATCARAWEPAQNTTWAMAVAVKPKRRN